MSFLALLITIGLFQGLFLGLALILLNKGNRKANKTMGFLVITFSLSVSHITVINLGLKESMTHLMMIGFPLLFLFGPLLLLYVKYLTQPDFKLNINYFYHFTPFIALEIYLIPTFYLNTAAEKLYLLNNWDSWAAFLDYVVSPIESIHFIIYLIIINRGVKNHNDRIKDLFSSLSNVNLKWLQQIFRICMGCILFYLALTLFGTFGSRELFKEFAGEAIALAVSIAIYTMGYFALRQPEIFVGEFKISQKTEEKPKPTKLVADEDSDKILAKLETFMAEEKPYLNNLVSIKDLATKTGIQTHHISFVLNNHLKLNFFDFINKYRIEDACSKLISAEYENSTVLEIAYEVGYNSKSAFNTSFKKFTGLTPTEYKKSKKN